VPEKVSNGLQFICAGIGTGPGITSKIFQLAE
jgi:hypothetical protein